MNQICRFMENHVGLTCVILTILLGISIILDEPTNHLDIGSQIKTLNLLKQSGKTVLTALHDLSIAARYCDRIYVLMDGEVYVSGITGHL